MSKKLPVSPFIGRPGAKESPYDRTMNGALVTALSEVAIVLNNEVAKIDEENIFTAEQFMSLEDATNNGVTDALKLSHTTTGTPANGIGVGVSFEVETAANHLEVGAQIQAVTTDVTNNTEDFDIVFRAMVAGALANVAKFSRTATARDTAFMIYDVDNNTVERVTVGVADSGGVGFKLLRIPN